MGAFHVCLWKNGEAIDLGPEGTNSRSQGLLVDDRGSALRRLNVDGSRWRVLPAGGTATALVLVADSGPWGVVNDVNAAGTAVGFGGGPGGDLRAFRWDLNPSGQPLATDLGTLGGHTSQAMAVNEAGWIVGGSEVAGLGESHPVLWRPVSKRK
jgi:uncharacterized membrane protein